VPYTYKLHSGSTVIQAIYDAHYDGARRVSDFVPVWRSLRGHVDDDRYTEVLRQLEYQASHAIVWRDAVNDWFQRISGIKDEKGRVGHHPDRFEAETMQLTGYRVFEPESWEGASGGKGITCAEEGHTCSAQTRFDGAAGWYEIDVEYFDLSAGISNFKLFVNDQIVDD